MRNFDYLKDIDTLRSLYDYCNAAEINQVCDPEQSAINSRRALEWITRAIYKIEGVEIKERTSLFELVDGQPFRDFVGNDNLLKAVHYIRKVGNASAHTGKVSKKESFFALLNIYNFVGAVLLKLGALKSLAPFNKELIPNQAPIHILPSAKPEPEEKFIESVDASTIPNEPVQAEAPDITEAETRKLFIDLMLKEAGWDILEEDGKIMPGKENREVETSLIEEFKYPKLGPGQLWDVAAEEIEKKGLVNFAGYQQRFHPCVMAARELLESHAIGRVTSVFAELGEDVSGMHKYEDYRTSYTAKKSLGGGVVMTQIHELDYLYSFFGMPESVYAVGGTLADFEIDVEDTADILMKVEHEGYKIPIHVHEDFVQRPATRHCKIVGTDGMILFDLLQNRISVYNRAGELTRGEVFDFDRNNMFYDEMKSFLDSLREKKSTTIPVREGVASLKIALAVKESMETGEIVKLQG